MLREKLQSHSHTFYIYFETLAIKHAVGISKSGQYSSLNKKTDHENNLEETNL